LRNQKLGDPSKRAPSGPIHIGLVAQLIQLYLQLPAAIL
jgi:hypothetical protein